MLQQNTTNNRLEYQGTGKNLFGMVLKNLFLTIITFGIYHAWAKTNVIKYHFQNTLFRDKPFTFYGTGKERFIGILKVLLAYALILLLSYGIATFLDNNFINHHGKISDNTQPSQMEVDVMAREIAHNTYLDYSEKGQIDKTFSQQEVEENIYQEILKSPKEMDNARNKAEEFRIQLIEKNDADFLNLFIRVFQIIFMFLLMFVFHFLVVSSRKYRTSRTVWEGVSFSYQDSYGKFLPFSLKQTFLTIITFGMYSPYKTMNHAKWFYSRLSFGNVKFDFEGDKKEYSNLFWKNFFFTLITLGIYSFKAFANKTNYIFNNVTLTQKLNDARYQGKLNTNYTAWDLFIVYLVVIFGFILTLGLAKPWIMTFSMSYFLESIVVENNIQWDLVEQETTDWNQSTGEILAEDYSIDVGAL